MAETAKEKKKWLMLKDMHDDLLSLLFSVLYSRKRYIGTCFL